MIAKIMQTKCKKKYKERAMALLTSWFDMFKAIMIHHHILHTGYSLAGRFLTMKLYNTNKWQ